MKMLKKPIVLAGVAAVVLLALGYLFVLPMVTGKPADTQAAGAHSEEAAEEDVSAEEAKTPVKRKKKIAEPGLVYPLTDRVLNLATTGGQPHFARTELALEFLPPVDPKGHKAKKADHGGGGGHGAPAAASKEPALDPALEVVNPYKPQIDDALVRIFGTKTVEGLTSAEGKEALKQEILDAVSNIVPKLDIVGVYIVRLIVQ